MYRGARILVARSDGSEWRILVEGGSLKPTDVIVDAVQEAVIWTSRDDANAMVESIKLDGSQRGVGIVHCYMVLQTEGQNLFLISQVIMSRLNGRFPISPASVAVFEAHLYVADQFANEVRSWNVHDIELYGRQNTLHDSKEILKQRNHRVGVARISHPALQRLTTGMEPNESCLFETCPVLYAIPIQDRITVEIMFCAFVFKSV